jgi:hypothetical protein
MKRLLILCTIVFAFGYVSGCIKNHTLYFSEWGYNSQKYVSIWWIIMGGSVTLFCAASYFIDKLMDDHQEEKEAYKENY